MIDRPALEVALAGAEPGELLAAGLEITGRGAAAMAQANGASRDEDRLLDMAEVAKVLGVVEGAARDLGRRGELPVVNVGRYVRVRASSLREWMAVRENGRLPHRRAD